MAVAYSFTEELAEAKQTIPTLEGYTLITCVPAQVRASYRKTEYKNLNVILQFPEGYPNTPLLVELTSKTLSEKLLHGLIKMCDEEITKFIGQKQVLRVISFVKNFVLDNPLCVCSEEIAAIKKELISDWDRIKLKQDASQIQIKAKQDHYLMNFRITVPDNYPLEQIGIDAEDNNFPDLLQLFFVGQATEIARRCVQPPLQPNPKDPPFKPKPSIKVVCEFLINDCVKRYPQEPCPVCKETVLLPDPEAVTREPRKRVERVYCGHLYHHGCLAKYMKTPPFKDGKFCPSCGKRIFHDKWKVTPELAEARWAHKQARQRELEEVSDFLK